MFYIFLKLVTPGLSSDQYAKDENGLLGYLGNILLGQSVILIGVPCVRHYKTHFQFQPS